MSDSSQALVPKLFKNENIIISGSEKLKNIRKNNPFLDQLGRLMDDPDFRSFYDNYFKDWGDLKASVMMMNTYILIEEMYLLQTGKRLNSDQIIYLLKKTMLNGEYRKMIVDSMSKYIDNKTKDFQEAFKVVFKENQDLLENVDSLQVIDESSN